MENISPASPAPLTTDQSVSVSRKRLPRVLIGVLVIGVIAGGAWYVFSLRGGSAQPTPSPTPDTGVLTPTPQPVVSGSPDPRLIADLPVLKSDIPEWNSDVDPTRFYRVGIVTQEPYAGAELIVAYIDCEGPCFYPMRYRFLRMTDGALILLQKYSDIVDKYSYLNTAAFTIDTKFTIAGLETPEVITAPNGAILELDRMVHQWFDARFSSNDLISVFEHAQLGAMYTDRQNTKPAASPDPITGVIPGYRDIRNGFYARRVDGSLVVYALRFSKPEIIWADGVPRFAEYAGTDLGGCGATNYAAVVPPYALDEQSDLVKTGMTKNGDPVFEYKNVQHPFLRNLYDSEYIGTWIESEQRYGNKMSYEEFINLKPVFFWRDQFGRLIRFRNNTFTSPAECGKPVIYLYPEQTAEVSVRVEPVGGMSFSEPAYGTGWTVTAQPDGILTDVAGNQWPYLFWEGRGGLYDQPQKGWVITEAEVESFLDEKLALYGLISKEIADFKEFWLPRMEGAPFYFVTFLGNRAMDELAPLTISPAPDTVIRVLMDFTPLDKPINVQPYTIRTPERDGFTVVEWGGVIR